MEGKDVVMFVVVMLIVPPSRRFFTRSANASVFAIEVLRQTKCERSSSLKLGTGLMFDS